MKWRAYSDNDGLGFELERSRDQHTWENIGWLDVNTSAFTADYGLLDPQPLTGKSYYRLKPVEKSGSSRYSTIRLIQIDQLLTDIKIYPNPAKNIVIVTLTSNASQPVTLQLRSLSGQVMIKKSMTLDQIENRIPIELTNIANGLYIVELITPERTYINKVVVCN
ncbi:MAG TPA: T9SS type A sorting domain-containing protein [Chitinophagaceae bacterium]|nr:T9SS type A sorting domain-containing protein [Chitinophagaceae bacterium]